MNGNETPCIDDDYKDAVKHCMKSVFDWDSRGETNAFIFYVEPEVFEYLSVELSNFYRFSIKSCDIYGWATFEVTVTK